MATSSTPPSATQLLFARSVIYTFDLWPALRLAVSEQWGGVESKAKADFLISHICDEYSTETSTSNTATSIVVPPTPDVDDLIDILEGYFEDEFESRLEDGSPDLIASRLVRFHKLIYASFPPTQESLATATEEVSKLEQAAIACRGQKVVAQQQQPQQQQQQNNEDETFSDDDESGSDEGSDDAMELDTAAAAAPSQSMKPEPMVDEDGFTTVVKSKRR